MHIFTKKKVEISLILNIPCIYMRYRNNRIIVYIYMYMHYNQMNLISVWCKKHPFAASIKRNQLTKNKKMRSC